MAEGSTDNKWYRIENESEVFSPSLLVYPERIEENIRRMVAIAGNVNRLRPHVKTHKMSEVVKLQMKYGISKFKCATIAEAEMAASCGALDILLAVQPVGPNIERFFRLKKMYGNLNIACIADSEPVIRQISETAIRYDTNAGIWLDINVGMNRTGILPGDDAIRLFRLTGSLPGLKATGLHVYDGHIHDKDVNLRRQKCDESYQPVQKMIDEIRSGSKEEVKIVAGGSPTFPLHALRKDVEVSPGTILLWDWGYGCSFTDMDFLNAAVLFTRVVSKPSGELICLDLGHKAVGSEMPQPRVQLLEIDDYTITGHNEEHMVVKSTRSAPLHPGAAVYAIPWHICPTVDRYDKVYAVKGNRVSEEWNVTARRRQISI
jgi:D-serine deaminase-like pyridoxal phosphate-dependent protein